MAAYFEPAAVSGLLAATTPSTTTDATSHAVTQTHIRTSTLRFLASLTMGFILRMILSSSSPCFTVFWCSFLRFCSSLTTRVRSCVPSRYVCRIQHIENPIRDKSKEFALHKLTLADSEEYGNIKNTTSLHFIFLVLFESSKLSLSHSFFIVSSTRQGRAASGGVLGPEPPRTH